MMTTAKQAKSVGHAIQFHLLGLHALEMQTGPFTFLISQGVVVAYHDSRPDAPKPGWFRSARQPWFTKAMTAHQNRWLKSHAHATVPHEQVLAALDSVSVYGSTPVGSGRPSKPSSEDIAAALEYLADIARHRGTEGSSS